MPLVIFISLLQLNNLKRVLHSVKAQMDEVSNASELAKNISVRDAISWIMSAWGEVRATMIKKCFQFCGFPGASEQKSKPQED